MIRHFLEIDDLTTDELRTVLDQATHLTSPQVLKGKGMALIWLKPSARTRNSAEMAVVQLGGHPVSIRADEISIGKRETSADVARTLGCYHSAIGARVFDHAVLSQMAAVNVVPIVNMLSDDTHPLQALADLLTLRQEFGSLSGLTVAYLGDFANVARSLAVGLAMVGSKMVACCPPGYGPTSLDRDKVAALGGELALVERPEQAVINADCVTTDAWYSMGQEAQAEARAKAFEGYSVNEKIMSSAPERAVFLHCLPAHRGQEVTNDVLDGPQSRIWRQAENRMHAARALFGFVVGASGTGAVV